MTVTSMPQGTGRANGVSSPLRDRGRRASRALRERRYTLYRVLGAIIVLGTWQIASSTQVINPVYVSSPWGWARTGTSLLISGELLDHIVATSRVLFMGLAVGGVSGFVIGVVLGLSRPLQAIANDTVAALYALPYIAFLPLVIVWFGIDDIARIVIVFYAVFFPVMLSTLSGVKNVEPHLLSVAKSFCASRLTTIRTVVLPGALPFVLTGVRLAIGRGLVGAVTAEFFMSSQGLGFFIYSKASILDSDAAFSAIVILAILGVILTRIVEFVERKVYERWGKD